MAKPDRPRTLQRAVHDVLRVYAAAAILALLVIVVVPAWVRWTALYAVGFVFLTSVLAPFVEDWKTRGRVATAGKAVFITGCDSGFGLKLAEKLDDLGLHVFAGCLFPEGDGAKALKKTASSKLRIVPLDVTSDESIDKAQKFVTQNLKDNKLWAIVNNAGLNDGAELLWTNVDKIQRILDVNTYGVVKVTKAFLPLLCKFKGRVVTVASAAGRYTYPGMVPYCMSKQATVSFCEGLRLEVYRFGLKVITVEPWMYKTPITNETSVHKYIANTWDSAPDEVKELHPGDYLERYKKATMKFLNFSINDNPQEVVDCLEEAVLATNPKYSYNPGTLYSRSSHWFMSRLPKCLADMVLNDEFSVPI